MEWLAVSIAIGLIVSLLFTEAYGLSVGGMIVPGYLALHCDRPGMIAMTLAVAALTWLIVHQVNRVAILFGRRRVVLTMVVGFAVGATVQLLMGQLTPAALASSEPESVAATWAVIGFVIPGLIALWIDRVGIVETLSPLVVATGLVRLVLIAFGMEAMV